MDKEPTESGRVIAVKKSLCYTGICYTGERIWEQSIMEKPLIEVKFKGKQIMIPEDYVVMTYFGKEILIHSSKYYGYQIYENQRRHKEEYEIKGQTYLPIIQFDERCG